MLVLVVGTHSDHSSSHLLPRQWRYNIMKFMTQVYLACKHLLVMNSFTKVFYALTTQRLANKWFKRTQPDTTADPCVDIHGKAWDGLVNLVLLLFGKQSWSLEVEGELLIYYCCLSREKSQIEGIRCLSWLTRPFWTRKSRSRSRSRKSHYLHNSSSFELLFARIH